jgi:hypoxanthine phosphoribosyltransferase
MPMDSTKLLKDKVVLIVDDEVDVTDTVEEVLDMCFRMIMTPRANTC